MSPVSLALLGALAAVAVLLFLLVRWAIGPPTAAARRWGLWAIRALVVAMLLLILANPVRLDQLPGSREKQRVFYLLDSSASMAFGGPTSRFDEALRAIRQAGRKVPSDKLPRLTMYRFGQQLTAIKSLPASESNSSELKPTDNDTQLLAALRQLADRFGRAAPHCVVLFSDGRARQPSGLEAMAEQYRRMNVPIHVLPLGAATSRGDVAVVSMIAPHVVRKYSQVDVNVLVRSYGYDGKRTELRLDAVAADGSVMRQLARLPITLSSGTKPYSLTFQSDLATTRLRASIPPREAEISTHNNAMSANVAIDRTKIRVLYIEGAVPQYRQLAEPRGSAVFSSPFALANALAQDPDIECLAFFAPAGQSRPQTMTPAIGGFPDSRAKLFACDALVLSNVGNEVIGTRELAWVDEWIGQRGGGLCMIGGPRGFAAGGWQGTPLEEMLPVSLQPSGGDWVARQRLTVAPTRARFAHPIWNIVADAQQNLAIVKTLPEFRGLNRPLRVKPNGIVLGVTEAIRSADGPTPVITVGRYGQGRAMAMMTGMTSQYAPGFADKWGVNDNRYYAKFWRNVVYWLTENSSTGRRRLIASADKISYRPGETIKLQAAAYDEESNQTIDCQVTVTIEPQLAADVLETDASPVRWPNGVARTSGEQGPYVAWGEEFDMLKQAAQRQYTIELPIADKLPGTAPTLALRIELSAYDEFALIDSTSIDVQVLDDPFEHRNPLPNPELLRRIATSSGGDVLSDASALADRLSNFSPVASPPTLHKVPLWSRWWLLLTLLVLLTVEWIWRRRLGLA